MQSPTQAEADRAEVMDPYLHPLAYDETPESWHPYRRDAPDYRVDGPALSVQMALSIVRARTQRVRAMQVNEWLYVVPSSSKEHCRMHRVALDDLGEVVDCADCPGWQNGHNCKHAGAVTWNHMVDTMGRLAAETHLVAVIEAETIRVAKAKLAEQEWLRDNRVIESHTTAQQIYRDER